jgi:hypothetical protein
MGALAGSDLNACDLEDIDLNREKLSLQDYTLNNARAGNW